MTNNLIVLLLLIGINCSLFAQTEKKISTELELVIYEGDAYKKWYSYTVNSARKIRELKEEKKDAVLKIIQKKIDKANKKEAKAKVFHTVTIPIDFILHEEENEERPWAAVGVKIKNDSIYEDDFLKVEGSVVKLENYTSQNYFRYLVKITNKHVSFLNSRNEWGHNIFFVEYLLVIDYDNGTLSKVLSSWGGSVYRSISPRVYKTDKKNYSFIPFLDRHEEAVQEKVLEAFK